jgi:hypothetical protein
MTMRSVSLLFLVVAGCGRSGLIDVGGPEDLGGADFARNDFAFPPPDLSTQSDFAIPPEDLAIPEDMTVPTDFARMDLFNVDFAQPPRDMSRPPPDLSRPPPDLSHPPDLSRPPPDMARADMSRPPDLLVICAGVMCNDNNPCTTDTCDPTTGKCVFTDVADGTSCGAGTACTSQVCQTGRCVIRPVSCNDNNPCTFDFCLPATGCQHFPLPNGSACNDNNICTVRDRCQGGTCTGTARNCDDGNSCTTDTCNPASGCVHTSGPDGALCDDNNPCTFNETCKAGVCQGGSVEPNGTSCIGTAGPGCCEAAMCCVGAGCGCP